jgi:hypothetical protein
MVVIDSSNNNKLLTILILILYFGFVTRAGCTEVTCPKNSYFDPYKESCQCKLGYVGPDCSECPSINEDTDTTVICCRVKGNQPSDDRSPWFMFHVRTSLLPHYLIDSRSGLVCTERGSNVSVGTIGQFDVLDCSCNISPNEKQLNENNSPIMDQTLSLANQVRLLSELIQYQELGKSFNGASRSNPSKVSYRSINRSTSSMYFLYFTMGFVTIFLFFIIILAISGSIRGTSFYSTSRTNTVDSSRSSREKKSETNEESEPSKNKTNKIRREKIEHFFAAVKPEANKLKQDVEQTQQTEQVEEGEEGYKVEVSLQDLFKKGRKNQ